MNIIPRDAAPTFTATPRAPLPKAAPPVVFVRKPVPPILPDTPPIIPPDVMVSIGDAILEPLVWHTGNADEIIILGHFNLSDFPYMAVVRGVWPAETEFEWSAFIPSDVEMGLITRTQHQALAIAIDPDNAYYGTLVASVMVTAPGHDPQTLGPITLTVTSSGCC